MSTSFWILFVSIIAVTSGQFSPPYSQYLAAPTYIGSNSYWSTASYMNRIQQGTPIKSITFWSGTDSSAIIVGIKITYSDGSVDGPTGSYKSGLKSETITFNDGEMVTGLCIWGDQSYGQNTAIARFNMQTSSGRNISAGRDQSSLPYGCSGPAVGSGTMIGVGVTYNGGNIAGMGFLFYAPITKIVLYNVTYIGAPGTSGTDSTHFSPKAVDAALLTPTPGGTWGFSGDVSRTETHTWTTSTSNTYGVSVTVSADILFAKVSTTASWSRTSTFESSSSISTEHTLTWDLGGTAPATVYPISCQANIYQAQLNLQYTGLLSIQFQNNQPALNPSTHGTYTNVVFSSVNAQCIVCSTSQPC